MRLAAATPPHENTFLVHQEPSMSRHSRRDFLEA